MFTNALYPKTEQVLEKLAGLEFVKKFYLAGGTGLAMQLGHRKSIDLDFFTSESLFIVSMLRELGIFTTKILQQSEGTLEVIADGVKVSFMQYDYPLVGELVRYNDLVNIASVYDIGCMKLTAISSRGSKKDFVDMYYILKQISFRNLLEMFSQKYSGVEYSSAHILRSLRFFEDADNDPELDFLVDINWIEIKKSLEQVVNNYISKELILE